MARVSRKPGQTRDLGKPECERIWNAALYVRLSVEDNGKDADSVENQIQLLESYVRDKPDLNRTELFVDNGYTGTDFLRPEYARMIEKAKKGEVDCIVVKDLSRLGRNYIETSQFIERVCPFLGIRFIAVNDGYDTLTVTSEGRLSASLSNIINDYYAKDISRKVTTALHAKMERGDFVANYAPYGYQKDPENRNRLIVCEEAAKVVRQIFTWRAAGESYMGICKRLNAAGIPSPGEYRLAHGIPMQRGKKSGAILWNRHVLTLILENRVYLGELVQRKQGKCLYAGIPSHVTREDERYCTRDAHTPLIGEALFTRVQQINALSKQRTQACSGKYDHLPKARNIYGKKLVCACCGRVLKLHRSFSTNRDKAYFMFKCPTHAEHGAVGCKDVKMRKAELDAVVLESIKAQISVFAQQQKVLEDLLVRKREKTQKKGQRQTLEELKKKLQGRKALLSNLYVDLKEGVLSRADYEQHREVVMSDVQALEIQIAGLEQDPQEEEQLLTGETRWKTLMQRFSQAKELSADMVEAFIESMKLDENGALSIRFAYQDELVALRKAIQRIGKGVA